MLEAALFRHDRVPGDVLHLANNRLTIEVSEANTFRCDHREIAVSKKEQVARVIENRGNVRRYEIFVFAKSNDRGRTIARSHNLVRLIHRNYGESKHAGELRDCFA